MNLSKSAVSASLFLTVALATGCSPLSQPLTQDQISSALGDFDPPAPVTQLSERSKTEFLDAYSKIERYTPKYPSASSACQAVAEFSRVPQYAQGGNSWKQYMPSDLRSFTAIEGIHYRLSTPEGVDEFATVSLDIAVLAFESASAAGEVASLVRENLEPCFDFPKTSMPVSGLDLDVLAHASTLIQSEPSLGGGGFSFEVVEDTYLELSKISAILDDSIVKENKIIAIRQDGAHLIALVATSSSKAEAVLGVSAFPIAEQFPTILDEVGGLLRKAASR